MGMKQKEYEEAVRELGFKFMVKPSIILIGMAVIGSIVDSFLKTQNTFAIIFAGVGGIAFLIDYYKKEIKKSD